MRPARFTAAIVASTLFALANDEGKARLTEKVHAEIPTDAELDVRWQAEAEWVAVPLVLREPALRGD